MFHHPQEKVIWIGLVRGGIWIRLSPRLTTSIYNGLYGLTFELVVAAYSTNSPPYGPTSFSWVSIFAICGAELAYPVRSGQE